MTEKEPTKGEMIDYMRQVYRHFTYEPPEQNDVIYHAIRALISQPPTPKVVMRERVENLVFDTYGYGQTLKEKMGIIEKFLADLGIEVEEKKA